MQNREWASKGKADCSQAWDGDERENNGGFKFFFVLLPFSIRFYTVKMFTDEMLKVLMIHIQTFTKLIPEPVFQKSLQESRSKLRGGQFTHRCRDDRIVASLSKFSLSTLKNVSLAAVWDTRTDERGYREGSSV